MMEPRSFACSTSVQQVLPSESLPPHPSMEGSGQSERHDDASLWYHLPTAASVDGRILKQCFPTISEPNINFRLLPALPPEQDDLESPGVGMDGTGPAAAASVVLDLRDASDQNRMVGGRGQEEPQLRREHRRAIVRRYWSSAANAILSERRRVCASLSGFFSLHFGHTSIHSSIHYSFIHPLTHSSIHPSIPPFSFLREKNSLLQRSELQPIITVLPSRDDPFTQLPEVAVLYVSLRETVPSLLSPLLSLSPE